MSKFIKETLIIARTHIDARDVLSDAPENVIVLVLSEAIELLQAEKDELEEEVKIHE